MKFKRMICSSSLIALLGAGVNVAGAQASGNASSIDALRAACSSDVERLCSGVQAGGGRIVACLKQHKEQVSDACKTTVMGAMQRSGGGGGSNSGATPRTTQPAAHPDSGSSSPSIASSPSALDSDSKPPSLSPKTSSKASSGAGNQADGSYLRMKQVQVIAKMDDPAFGGKADVPALDMLIPSGWSLSGGVNGNTREGCFSDIFSLWWEAKAQDGVLAFQGVPNDSWQYADDPAVLHKLNDPNRRARGLGGKPCPVKEPMKAEDYLRQNVLTVFPSGSTIVSVDPYPELNQIARKQLGLSPDDSGAGAGAQTDAVRARVKFQKDGKNMEDWVTAVIVTRRYRQGRGSFYDCHAIDIMAFRAPEGQLDGNEKLLRVMISSIHPEQKWETFSNGFIAKLYQEEAQKEAIMDKMVADFQRQVAETINGVVANSVRGANQAAFGQDQLIRGVQTFRDPTTGNTMELSNQYDHAWLNGSNEYVMSDDPNFNPNGQLSGEWNQLQLVRPQP